MCLISKKAFLEFLRNLTPQIILCTMATSNLKSPLDNFNWPDFLVFLVLYGFFLIAAIVNAAQLMGSVKRQLHAKGKPSIPAVMNAMLLITVVLSIATWVVVSTAVKTTIGYR